MESSGTTVRCSPESLIKLARLLSEKSRERVKKIGLGSMLKLSSMRPSGKMLEKLMNRARVTDEDKIALYINDEVELILEREDVFLVLGVGMKGAEIKDLPAANAQSSNVTEQMYRLLKHAAEINAAGSGQDQGKGAGSGQDQDKDAEAVVKNKDDTVAPVQGAKRSRRNYFMTGCIQKVFKSEDEKIKAELDDEMGARLFCMEALKFLVSSSSSTMETSIQDAVTDLDKLKNVDWCTVVYERMKTGISVWHNPPQDKPKKNPPKNKPKKNPPQNKPMTRNPTGCIYLLLVNILFLFSLCVETQLS